MAIEIKRELDFGLDHFGNQKILSLDDSIAQMVLNILFLRPGQIPSLPYIGVNIEKYLYRFEEELDVQELLTEIRNQCSPLMGYIDIDAMYMAVIEYENYPLLVLNIPLRTGTDNADILIGFKKNDDRITADYSLINLLKK